MHLNSLDWKEKLKKNNLNEKTSYQDSIYFKSNIFFLVSTKILVYYKHPFRIVTFNFF